MAERTSDPDRTQADQEDRAKRLEAAANPSGDFAAPELGVTRLPDETAEEGSTDEANAAIRDVLRQQSGRTDGDDGGQQQTTAQRSEPEPAAAPAPEEEPAPTPKRSTARHADE